MNESEIGYKKEFTKYVSQNVLGMIGVSVYVLADTYFISRAVGSDGVTALNLVLPVYNLIFAIGQMIGVGSAIRFSIEAGTRGTRNGRYFSNALVCATLIGLMFSAVGYFFADRVIALLGGDEAIVSVGMSYTRIFMTLAPFFMWNHICNAFVRNDGSPSIAMAATLVSSMFNICFDYLLMFVVGMGMKGAALATALSPLVGIGVCCFHFFSGRNTIRFRPIFPDVRMLLKSASVGVAAFIGEMSSGVITIVFNLLILGLEGNVGVAAYGVIANMSMVVMSVFNGISQGTQPLASRAYGAGEKDKTASLIKLAIGTGIVASILIETGAFVWSGEIAGMFNRDNDQYLLELADRGLKLYFTGFLFASVNCIGANLLSSMNRPVTAFVISMLRGFVLIVVCAVVMASVMGLDGVWLAFPVAEFMTGVVTVAGLVRAGRR